MTKDQWKKSIKKACKKAGTYQPFFDDIIATLAGILDIRDKAESRYISTGANPVIVHTNKSGVANVVKNPALVVIMDCNTQALAYWKELGLTSKAYKQMTGGVALVQEGKTLEDLLSEM